ncbi:MAG: alpha-1,2-fucosyltransferase [Verrucomicrobia bacterium]|nr:alpha-1,2-fucosyltransferase [Verrucomicrobiota bacterium]
MSKPNSSIDLALKPMVVRLDCGFGNQLFQVALGEWLGRRFGREVVYDTTGLAGSGRTALPLSLCGGAAFATKRSELGWRRAYWLGGKYNALLLKMVRATGLGRTPVLFLDDEGRSDSAPVPTRPPVWAVGFWQNVTFVDKEVLDVMDRRLNALPQAGAGAETGVEDEGIAVHLRWGDYKSDEQNRRRHGLLGPGYYRAALDALGSDRPVTVFSETEDAADWFVSHCRKDGVRYAGRRDMWQDFFGLSRFRRVVIANSSFSWWAAAHRSAGKSVVMPARWFALDERWGRNASRRLRRTDWIQVENDWL